MLPNNGVRFCQLCSAALHLLPTEPQTEQSLSDMSDMLRTDELLKLSMRVLTK